MKLSVLQNKKTTALHKRGMCGGGGCTEQRHVSVMVAVTQKLTGWRDVKGEIYQD